MLDVKGRPGCVDFQKAATGAASPPGRSAGGSRRARSTGRWTWPKTTMSAVPRQLFGILAIDAQVALFVGVEPALVAPRQDLIEGPGKRPGHVRKRFEERAALHPRLPGAAGAQEMAVDDPQPQAVERSCHEARR